MHVHTCSSEMTQSKPIRHAKSVSTAHIDCASRNVTQRQQLGEMTSDLMSCFHHFEPRWKEKKRAQHIRCGFLFTFLTYLSPIRIHTLTGISHAGLPGLSATPPTMQCAQFFFFFLSPLSHEFAEWVTDIHIHACLDASVPHAAVQARNDHSVAILRRRLAMAFALP